MEPLEGWWDCPVRGCLVEFPSAETLEDHFEQAHRDGALIGCAVCAVWVTQETFRRLHRLSSKRCSQLHREGMEAVFRERRGRNDMGEVLDGPGHEGAHHVDDAPHAPAAEPRVLPRDAPFAGPRFAAGDDDLPGFPSEYYQHYVNCAYSNRRPGEHNPFFALFAKDIKRVYGCVHPSKSCCLIFSWCRPWNGKVFMEGTQFAQGDCRPFPNATVAMLCIFLEATDLSHESTKLLLRYDPVTATSTSRISHFVQNVGRSCVLSERRPYQI